MNLIIPMAGLGTRLRPHTLTTPKPLISIYGKPIVFHLIDEIRNVLNEKIDIIAFVTGRFGKEVENSLIQVAEGFGSKGIICYQDEPKGTAHAVYCAKEVMEGRVVIAFADTIFKSKLKIESKQEGVIWVKEVENPGAYGVVTLENNIVSGFVEKPVTPVSNLAIIGIYYFKDGNSLKSEIEYLINNHITVKGEYQLTDALENLRKKGARINAGIVEKWMDCGSKDNLLYTNRELLEIYGTFFGNNIEKNNVKIIDPCYIENNVIIENSVIGPNVSIGNGTIVKHSKISDSIIMNNSILENVVINTSIIGSHCIVRDEKSILNLGDYSTIGE